MAQEDTIKTWRKRIDAANSVREEWENTMRVKESYQYWRGNQLKQPMLNGRRRVQVNKIHPEVRENLPSMYFYRPFARITAEPELADTPGSTIEMQSKLLQDTANYLVRHRDTGFRENTYLPLLESHWSIGCVEVGYSAKFVDLPQASEKPELKEKKDTKVNKNAPVDDMGLEIDDGSEPEDIDKEIARLKSGMTEKFYVRHIPANRILISVSNLPVLTDNDWVGYWEDMALSDVKASKAYKNTKNLKAAVPGNDKRNMEVAKINDTLGETEKVRVYKIWNLRTLERFVIAEKHDKYLLRDKFRRCPLIFLRFDTDPYNFLPIPPIYHKLGPQDEYNKSREDLSIIRDSIKTRFTYDSDAVESSDMKKLESGVHGVYVPRKPGTSPDAVSPIQQNSHSEGALATLQFSDKEFKEVGGVGGDARESQEATATQAKIAAAKSQVKDSFDRGIVANWLGEIIKELLILAIENMNVDRIIQTNVAPDSQFFQQASMEVAQTFEAISADKLQDNARGLNWDVIIDVESLSPVSEEEAFQKWMQGLTLIGNPGMSMLFAVSPELLKMTLEKMGIKSARDQQLIIDGMQKYMQMQQQMAQQGQQPGPGVSPMGGGAQPGQPQPDAGGPQPGGPVGPGASQ